MPECNISAQTQDPAQIIDSCNRYYTVTKTDTDMRDRLMA